MFMKATDFLLSLKREEAPSINRLYNEFISDIFRLTGDDANIDQGQCDGIRMRIDLEAAHLLSINKDRYAIEKMRQAMDIANFIHGCN